MCDERLRPYPRWLSCFHRRLKKILGFVVGLAFGSITGNIWSTSLHLELFRTNSTHIIHITDKSLFSVLANMYWFGSYYLVVLQNVRREGERRTVSVRRSIEVSTELCVSYRVALSFLDYHVFLRYTIIAQHRRCKERTRLTVSLLGFVFWP